MAFVTITQGTGTNIAVDLVGSNNYQTVKLDVGAAGNASGPVAANNPMPIYTPPYVHLNATPTITAGAYTSGQQVGGLISLSGAARFNSGSGSIQGVSVTVKTLLTAPFDVLFFDTQPTNGTYSDFTNLNLNTADIQYLCPSGVVHCADLVSLGTPQLLQAPGINVPFAISAANTNLYAIIVLRGAQTFASTSAIVLNVAIQQN